MRIGIDGHHLNGKPQGSRTYLLGLIQALARIAPDDRLFIYSFEPKQTRGLLAAPGLTHRLLFPESARVRIPLVVPALEMRDRLSVFHSQYICPPLSMVPEVVTIHDILFETHPDLFVGAFSSRSVRLIRRSVQRARRVLTVSDFSRRALLERYGLPEEKVITIHDAVDHARFRPMNGRDDRARLEDVRKRYGLEKPYVLSVGRLEPRKNLVRLIRGYRQARKKLDPGLELILVGKKDFRYQEIEGEVQRSPDGVRLLGPVPDDDLPALYNLARVFVFPSLVEGFSWEDAARQTLAVYHQCA